MYRKQTLHTNTTKFFMHSQKEGKSIDQYITALRTLTRTCDFGDIRDSLIRDRIVLGVKNLQKSLEICRAEKLSTEQSHRMAADTSAVSSMDAVQCKMLEEEDDVVATQVATIRKGQFWDLVEVDQKIACTRCDRKH